MARIQVVIEGETAEALIRETHFSGWTMQQIISRILLDGIEIADRGILTDQDERLVELEDVTVSS